MNRLFVDTGGWYALVDKNDPEHAVAKQLFVTNTIPCVTTNFVFDETVTLIRTRLGWSVARDFGVRLKDSSFATLVPVKNEDEERAWNIFLKYKDKDFSYTDCTSFAVMERLRMDTAFSFDSHFLTMKFKVVP